MLGDNQARALLKPVSFQSRVPLLMCHIFELCFGCSHNSKRERGKFQFFRFPSILLHQREETNRLSEERRRQWLANINRADLDDTKADRSRVCSSHLMSCNTIVNAMN